LLAQTQFQRYQWLPVPFSYFALPDSLSYFAVPSASGRIFMFCVLGLIFGDPEGDGFRFHVLRVETSFWRYGGRRVLFSRFRRYGGCRVPFSCYARPDSISAKTRVPCAVFMLYALGVVFGGTDGVGSRFHVLRVCDPFSRAPHRLWRWDADEGHGDPSQACICLMPVDSTV
jgi:hypothetical protein